MSIQVGQCARCGAPVTAYYSTASVLQWHCDLSEGEAPHASMRNFLSVTETTQTDIDPPMKEPRT